MSDCCDWSPGAAVCRNRKHSEKRLETYNAKRGLLLKFNGTIARTSPRGSHMGLITPNDFPSLQALYTTQLRYLLSTENQIVKGLQDMIEHADDPQLKQAFQSHLQETEVHVSRLKQLIGDVDNDVDDKKDPILTAIAGSAKNITKETDSGPIRDAGLIATAQKIEHYEIASYGSARDWAMQLGLTDHASTLQATLDEEKHADQLLSQISQRANRDASTVAA
jgi:ferritin-like metal-binding protein YciE